MVCSPGTFVSPTRHVCVLSIVSRDSQWREGLRKRAVPRRRRIRTLADLVTQLHSESSTGNHQVTIMALQRRKAILGGIALKWLGQGIREL